MASLDLVINDQIRDEQIRVEVDEAQTIGSAVEGFVAAWGLPRRNLTQQPIHYQLVRALDDTFLDGDLSFEGAGIGAEETLNLASLTGRRVYQTVDRLRGEIEDLITDKASGALKDQVSEDVWNRVTGTLAEIEKTQSGDQDMAHVRAWIENVGGPSLELTDMAYDAPETEPTPMKVPISGPMAGARSKRRSARRRVAASVAALVVLAILVVLGIVFLPDILGGSGDRRDGQPVEELQAMDSDGDRLNDYDEEVEFETDPSRPDTDGDALDDGTEVLEFETNPLDPDTDHDGHPDGVEVLELGSDPTRADDPGE